MSVVVRRAEPDEYHHWDRCVKHSAHSDLFHRRALLERLTTHSSGTFHPLIGYKGKEPIALLPVFETKLGPLTVARSPPSEGLLEYMGPVLASPGSKKSNTVETENQGFIEEATKWIHDHINPDLIDIRCSDRYTDVRPFLWRGFDVTPAYTYLVDLSVDKDDLLESFSASARNKLSSMENHDYEIRRGDIEDLELINEQVRERHQHKNVPYPITNELLVDLYTTLGADVVRPFVCEIDGDIEGGIITLSGTDTEYRWLGGVKPATNVPINELLDWHIMRDAIDRNLERYDLHGAMERGVWEYKSKFAPRPTPIFIVYWKSLKMKAATNVYQRLPEPLQAVVQ